MFEMAVVLAEASAAAPASASWHMMNAGSGQRTKLVEVWGRENVVLLVKGRVELAAKMMTAFEGIRQSAVDSWAEIARGKYVVQPLPNLSKEHLVTVQDLAVARRFGPSKISDAAAGLSGMTHSVAPFSRMVALAG